MQPVIAKRPVAMHPQYLHPQNVAHQPPINSRVVVRPPPIQHPTYVQNMPLHVQPSIASHPVYSPPIQTVPIQGYMPQYQPLYVQGPPIPQQIPQYYNQYIQQVPVNPYRNVHPQMQLNHNFDYQAANFLTDTTIVENSVFCVICGNSFKASEKDQHLKKHMRRADNSTLPLDIPTKSVIQSKVGIKKQYIVKPLVQPEEHTIQYQPLVYELVQEVLYQDKPIPKQDEAIGNETILASFSIDPNMSFDKKNSYSIPNQMKTEANPFASKGTGQILGNTLNEPVPFLNYNPTVQNSSYHANEKMNQSVLSKANNNTNPVANNVSQGSQADKKT